MKPANKICRKEFGYLVLYIILGMLALMLVLIPILTLAFLFNDIISHSQFAGIIDKRIGTHALIWIQDILIFFLPAYWWCKNRLRRDPLTCYGFRKFDWRWIFLACCACLTYFVLMDPISTFFYNLQYPEGIQEYLNEEKISSFETTKNLMTLPGVGGFIECVLLTCFAAGIVEETMCRGALLKCLGLSTLNPHIVAVLVGIIFSAIHGQYFGFLDRALFGVVACYLVYWSGSIWPAITFHALNNFLCILQYRSLPADYNPLDSAETLFPWYINLASTVAFFLIIRKMYEMREIQQRLSL